MNFENNTYFEIKAISIFPDKIVIERKLHKVFL